MTPAPALKTQRRSR